MRSHCHFRTQEAAPEDHGARCVCVMRYLQVNHRAKSVGGAGRQKGGKGRGKAGPDEADEG